MLWRQARCRWPRWTAPRGQTGVPRPAARWLLDSPRDVLAHADLIGRAATALGKPITPAIVRGYARPERRLIVEHGVDHAGRPLYRVGDVLDQYDRIQAEQARRTAAWARRPVRDRAG